MRYNLYRVEKLIVQKFHADDAKVGIMGKVFLQQQKLVGLPESGLRGEQAAEFLEGINLCMRAPLPPCSGFNMAGKRKSSRRAKTSMSLNMIERGCSIPSFLSRATCARLESSKAKTSKPLRT